MKLGLIGIIIGALAAFGGLQEFLVRGIQNGEIQPLLVGLAGAMTGLLLILAGVAIWRQWPSRYQWAISVGALTVTFHLLAALPPHRNVGLLTLLLIGGYGLLLLAVGLRQRSASRAGLREPAA